MTVPVPMGTVVSKNVYLPESGAMANVLAPGEVGYTPAQYLVNR